MKLYTEEQVIEAIILCIHQHPLRPFNDIIAKLEAIELPTDEEIYNNAPFHDCTDYSIANHHGFMIGAKWMRDKIQGGNQ